MVPDEIVRLARLGWKFFPRAPRARAACFKGASAQATSDLERLTEWARQYPRCGWQAVCGPSGIWALDVDVTPRVDGVSSLRELIEANGALPRAPTARTGGGGWLIVFRAHGAPLIGTAGWRPGLDPRRGAQSITVPPTVHHRSGRPYRWIVPPWDVPPPPAPQWLTRLLAPPPQRHFGEPARQLCDAQLAAIVNRVYDRLLAAREGARNVTLYKCSVRLGTLLGPRFPETQARVILMDGARRMGLSHAEAAATIRSGLEDGRAIAS